MEVKQVIVMRKDLGMSAGKIGAQAAHASMKVFFDRFEDEGEWHKRGGTKYKKSIMLSSDEKEWADGRFTKVVLAAKNEDHLMKVYNAAKDAGLTVSLIKDAALTELAEPAYTCIAIGPHSVEKLSPVTKRLQVYRG